MSKLPEHKKSPEEIARLREDLGIVHRERHHPVPPPPAGPSRPDAAPPHHPAVASQAPPSQPPADPHRPQQTPPQTPQQPRTPKPVRSLKRSERLAPAAPHARAHTDSSRALPDHRHSPEQLAELRRREAMAAMAEGGFEMPREASTALLALTYGLALGGAASPQIMVILGKIMASHHVALALGKGYHLLVAGCVAALALAAYIYRSRTQSRHHAALVAVMAALALVFSLLHYFPALQYGQ